MKKIILLIFIIFSLEGNELKKSEIYFAAGCFWGVEDYFSKLEGVLMAQSGYAGGNYSDPNYEKVLKYRNYTPKNIKNYTETVKVVYNKSKISTKKLIQEFFELHDPTQGDRQGNDIGNNYRSAIFYIDKNQKYIALALKDIYQKLLKKSGYGKITTEIDKLEKFYPAEEYHQNYLKKNPFGYCPNHRTGVKFTKSLQEEREFYKLIGKYKLGVDSDAYKVAFGKDTDSRFCKRYDKFKDTPDGVFIDIISGEPLFDTNDRFNSHSGWLSFYKAIDGSVEYRDDYSYGMHRIEVLAKKSGIHLGHVFDDVGSGKKRYCINASVLEFVPRD